MAQINQSNQPFCDFITVKQTHQNPHQPIYGEIAEYTNQETGENRRVYQFKTIKGNHNSSFQIRSDGYTVEYSGNPSRFNQVNNVQGFSLDTCKSIINKEIALLGLPPFSAGKLIYFQSGTTKADSVHTGARFTRIDYTQNFKTGSPRRRDIYLQWIQTQNYGKLEKTAYQNLNTYFGKETESRTFKIYNKALLLQNEKSPHPIVQILENSGAIRYEMCYRSILKTRHTNLWANATHKALAKQFTQDTKPMKKSIQTIDLSELPQNVKGTYALYIGGFNPKQELPTRTFMRHKKILMSYGVDISNTITRLIPKKEIITLEPFEEGELLQN